MSNYTQFDPANPPPPLMTGEPGSFAYHTMTTRLPVIIQNVLADHASLYPYSIVRAVQNLYDELVQNQPIRPLEMAAPDGLSWAEAWQPYQGRRWLEVPWYFAEAFIYRRLMEAVGYFGGNEETKRRGGEGGQSHREATLRSRGAGEQEREGDTDIAGLQSAACPATKGSVEWVSGRELPGETEVKDWIGVDPFLPRKQVELQSEATWGVLAAALSQALDDSADSFRVLLHHCVWGNRADLSYTKVAETAGGRIVVSSEQANLLVDDTEAVLVYLQGSGVRGQGSVSSGQRSAVGGRIDFICDNAGTELLLDLALVYFLLRFDWTTQVTLHVKAHPTFVSDATLADIELTLAAIRSQVVPEFAALGAGLESYYEQQRLRIQADIFWNSSRFFWEIPRALEAQLSQARLVIIKGDANYRRLLGDSRCWPTTIPAARAIPYFPAPFVALRTLKSDPIVGLKPGQAEQLDRQDAEWRVNGRRGMIQFVK